MKDEKIDITNVAIVINNLENNEELLDVTLNNLNNLKLNNSINLKIVIAEITENTYDNKCYDKLKIKNVVCLSEKDIYYNIAKKIEADYISFIKVGDKYSLNLLDKLSHYFSNYPKRNIFTMNVKYTGTKEKYELNRSLKKMNEVCLEKNKGKLWMTLGACFISNNILKELDYPYYDLKYDMDKSFFYNLLALNGGFAVMKKTSYIPVNYLQDITIGKEYIYDTQWYVDIFQYWEVLFIKLINIYNMIPIYFQKSFMYDLYLRIDVNINTSDKHVVVDEKYDEFIANTKRLLKYIDDEIIMNDAYEKHKVNPQLKFWLLKLKYNKELEQSEYREYKNEITLTFNNKDIFYASDKKIAIHLMDNNKEILKISGIYAFPLDTNRMRIYAEYGNKKYYLKKVKRYSDYKVFGKIIYTNYAFDVEIPLSLPQYKNELRFYLETEKSTVNLEITYLKPMSKLSNSKESYWCFDKFILYPRTKRIMVLKKNKKRLIKKELMYLKSLFNSKNKIKREAAKIRILYFITKPLFKKKKIWIFFDKMYKAGDNAEYLYRYALKQNDGFKKYYILRDDVPDAKRLKKDKIKFVKYGSLKHKIVFLNAKTILATHCNVSTFNTFNKDIEKFFRGLFKYNVVCIAHGLTVQSIPHNQNRIVDNTKLYPLPTYIEKENIDNELYDYKDKNIVTLSGMCRYDGLKNNDKKQILITPTWRTYLAIPSQTGKARGYNEVFKNTNYYRLYNSLINNNKLIEKAKEKGYNIIYLLHPVTSSQIDDYERNDYVQIVAATDELNYEKILTESSLMVTDYSGIQFDFAYMYKPVIYYHPKELPASYDEGAYKYDTMSLGEIIKTEDKLVDTICEYMENDCKIKEKYKKRIDDFFVYHDHNNCKRIYNEVIKFEKKCNKNKKKRK